MLRFSGLPAKPSYSALFPLRCIEKQAEFRLKRPSCAQAADRRLRRVLKASLAKPASSITIDDLTRLHAPVIVDLGVAYAGGR